MKKLLVIADREDHPQEAFLKAVDFAKKSGAAIHVAIFCYEPMEVLAAGRSGADNQDLKTELIRHKEQWWQGFVTTHRAELEITHEVVWEKYVKDWVIKHCQTCHYDLIVKTGHRSETAFYTPTDWQLFRDATVPVYIVAREHFKPRKVILVALDVLAKSAEKRDLNKQLIESAFRLSVQTDAVLHCAYVIKIPTLLKDLDLIDTTTYLRKAKAQVEDKLAGLTKNYELAPDCMHIEHGEPWGALSNLAKKLRAQCVVVGSMGRKGIAGKLIGNTAEKIIHIANTDLLVISPEVKVV